MGLNGIDISSWQDDLVVSAMGTCDFVIVKATGGAGYSNECFRRHANETLAAGKLLGCYHYARDRGYEGSAEAEVDHFISAFKPYVGKAIPFLDWEADALSLGVAWAKKGLDRVKAKTGVTPGIYTSKSALFSYDWSSVAKTYHLWVAQYPNYEDTGFLSEPWTDGWDFGAWSSPLIFQYTGTGRIPGYGGHLDLDLFYGTKDDWRRLCAVAGASAGAGEVKEVAISRANVAAQIMEHLCNCAEHGYSQPGRHGTSGHCSVQTDAGTVRVTKGDRDCSSAVCEAWELALAGTAYDGLITRYNWTGGMREMFVGSGLFSWKPMSFNASRGDIYSTRRTTRPCASATTARPTCWASSASARPAASTASPATRRDARAGSTTTTAVTGTAYSTTTARPTPGARQPLPALVRPPATFQSLRRGSSPESSEMAMQEGRRSDRATTRCRRRSTGSCLVGRPVAPTTWTPWRGA